MPSETVKLNRLELMLFGALTIIWNKLTFSQESQNTQMKEANIYIEYTNKPTKGLIHKKRGNESKKIT